MTGIVVYTTGDGCMQCRLTKRLMDDLGLAYRDIDLTDPVNDSAREYVTDDLGYSSAPVVVVDDRDHWAGFRPDRIQNLLSRLVTAQGC
ncbi:MULTISPECIES: glutaredoxin family protein [Microbacterium]|uniref:Glutaredoxin family protein n=1 Tax=Microbacterium wangchenii TaxID=2541726 RepID=A0ABX5SZ38_9MICO|nr:MULTISPECIES: glutaredoxin family protein [Microbacterium]MCK6065778.1 glutaredoxin family protein [Microbacterium sp. EYE_512]QBR90094.1 glutaredoxin family protein [Microbacterium wangchenii]